MLKLKSANKGALELLEADGWTVEALATATVKELVVYAGIGRVGATRIISEAAGQVNQQGLGNAEALAQEAYYQKHTPEKILRDWSEGGLTIYNVAFSPVRAIVAAKGISEDLARKLISEAQKQINRERLYQSNQVAYAPAGGGSGHPAFPVAWLSGDVEPPGMSVRIRRNFERAREAYKATNG